MSSVYVLVPVTAVDRRVLFSGSPDGTFLRTAWFILGTSGWKFIKIGSNVHVDSWITIFNLGYITHVFVITQELIHYYINIIHKLCWLWLAASRASIWSTTASLVLLMTSWRWVWLHPETLISICRHQGCSEEIGENYLWAMKAIKKYANPTIAIITKFYFEPSSCIIFSKSIYSWKLFQYGIWSQGLISSKIQCNSVGQFKM